MSQAWPIRTSRHSPSPLHQMWTREPGSSALSIGTEKLPLPASLEAGGGHQLRQSPSDPLDPAMPGTRHPWTLELSEPIDSFLCCQQASWT